MRDYFKTFSIFVAVMLAVIVMTLAGRDNHFPSAVPLHAQVGATWTEHHGPAADTKATISRAAATTGVHVLDCAVGKLAAGAAAPTAVTVNLVVRDGATAAGTIKLSVPMSVPAVAGDPGQTFSQCGLNIVGTVNTAMTIEFSAAGGANTVESVFMKGFTR